MSKDNSAIEHYELLSQVQQLLECHDDELSVVRSLHYLVEMLARPKTPRSTDEIKTLLEDLANTCATLNRLSYKNNALLKHLHKKLFDKSIELKLKDQFN